MKTIFIAALLCWNLFVFLVFGYDKRCAVLHKRRIPERILLAFSLLLGSYAALSGMLLFRHKTRKLKFQLVLPLCLLLHSILLFCLFTGQINIQFFPSTPQACLYQQIARLFYIV